VAGATKRVVVVASGATESESLGLLLRHHQGVEVVVRTPPATRPLTPEMAGRIVHSVWWSTHPPAASASKFVVLLDADGADPEAVVGAFREDLRPRLAGVVAPCLVSAVTWHLETWFFADAQGLRTFLGRDLGAVDPSAPDEIERPKLHLRNLLAPRIYTSKVAREIAHRLGPDGLRRSPSFRAFENSVLNGPSTGEAEHA
jgi:hypothetical protein